jgi:hypothetical protein
MPYSQEFAERIRKILKPLAEFLEKEMFGGVAFMVDEKMCVGINRDKVTGVDRLMARIGPGYHSEALKRPGCREMDFVGRPMTGFVFVHPEGYGSDEELTFWIEKTLEYNRLAPAKPPRKKLVPKEPKKTVVPLPKKPGAAKLKPMKAAPAKKKVAAKPAKAVKKAKQK